MIGMNTQIIKSDIKSFLASSDEQQSVVLGQRNHNSTEDKYSENFSDHFDRAGDTVRVEVLSSKDTAVLGSEKQHAEELDTDIASLLSVPIITPFSTKSSNGSMGMVSDQSVNSTIRPSNNDMPVLDDQSNGQWKPQPANASMVDWEYSLAESAPLKDNFTAVETAIARYSAKNDHIEEADLGLAVNPQKAMPKTLDDDLKSLANILDVHDRSKHAREISVSDRPEETLSLGIKERSIVEKGSSIESANFRPAHSYKIESVLSEKNDFGTSESRLTSLSASAGTVSSVRSENSLETTKQSGLSRRDIDADSQQEVSEKPKERVVGNQPGLKGLTAKSIAPHDSQNLRFVSNNAVERVTQKPTSDFYSPKSEAANIEKLLSDIELPTSSVDRTSSPNIPAHLANLTTAAANPKPTVFDWTSPNFAERFATEISDLTVNGALKKFEINPRNLGRLEVALIARGNSEIIQIEAESLAARDVIIQHSQVIQDMLKAQGRSDLTIRVDLRDGAFADTSNGAGAHLAQQNGTDKREGHSNSQPGHGSNKATELKPDLQDIIDEGRYA